MLSKTASAFRCSRFLLRPGLFCLASSCLVCCYKGETAISTDADSSARRSAFSVDGSVGLRVDAGGTPGGGNGGDVGGAAGTANLDAGRAADVAADGVIEVGREGSAEAGAEAGTAAVDAGENDNGDALCTCLGVNMCCNGCRPINTGESCDDGFFCNGADTCDGSGNCIHSGDPCASGDECHNRCNDAADSCSSPDGADCDYDGDPMTVDLCNPSGSCIGGPKYCDLYRCWKIPPTEQNTCYDATSYGGGFPLELACPIFPCEDDGGPDLCGQDAQYPDNERVFVESTEGSDDIVTDSLTGLIWQKTYITNVSLGEAMSYCDGLTFAGQTDWRLPDAHELVSLVSYGKDDIASAFPEMPSDSFWSSSVAPAASPGSGYAQRVWFANGDLAYAIAGDPAFAARCVRGESFRDDSPVRFYVSGVAGEQTVLDRATGLMWQKRYEPRLDWKQALAYCEGLTHAGFDDWRLPNINEAGSLVDFGKYGPASDFPTDIPLDAMGQFIYTPLMFLTSTYLWYVDFDDGRRSQFGLTRSIFPYPAGCVRCVRGGP